MWSGISDTKVGVSKPRPVLTDCQSFYFRLRLFSPKSHYRDWDRDFFSLSLEIENKTKNKTKTETFSSQWRKTTQMLIFWSEINRIQTPPLGPLGAIFCFLFKNIRTRSVRVLKFHRGFILTKKEILTPKKIRRPPMAPWGAVLVCFWTFLKLS